MGIMKRALSKYSWIAGGLGALCLAQVMTFAQEGGESKPAPQEPAPQEPGSQDPGPKAAPKQEAPKVTGKVLFDGELPIVKDLNVPARAAEGCCPPGEEVNRQDMSLRIDKDRGIAGVVVTVFVKGKKVDVPKEPYLLDQKGCRFTPHIQVVPKGAKVAFLNSDETSHNVHLISILNDPLNQTVLAGKQLERIFKEAEAVKVTCDMHTWMNAWLVVTDATHWGVTDETGSFSLGDLPAGAHEVKFWHETLGTKKATLTVGVDGMGSIEVKMAKKKRKSSRRRRR